MNRRKKIIAVGSKGTGFILGDFPETYELGKTTIIRRIQCKRVGATPEQVCQAHAAGQLARGIHPSLACYDLMCAVSKRGEPVLYVTLQRALKRKIVKPIQIRIARKNISRTVEVYVPYTWKPANGFPQYMATAELPYGCVQHNPLNDGRAVSLCWNVSLLSARERQIHRSNQRYLEKFQEVKLTKLERNPKARKECLSIHGDRCAVCYMSFGDTYGPEFEGYIHVHHLKPGSSRGGIRTVDAGKELIPLCPNCHAAVHFKRKMPRTIQQIRRLFRRGL